MSAYEDRQRLAALMNRSRLEQKLEWKDVAKRGDISDPTLRRIRNKPESTLTEDAKIRIEDGLGWTPGDVDGVLAGGTYTYRRPMLDAESATVEQIINFMLDMEAKRRPDFRLLLSRIDARWFTTP
ncbi:hypothetical protein [Kibdelosporangium phytohabitans]|nr:hypothetical protein [Kibdelosporangium phytohabitans]MBE1471703.1 hypothetical protein [Kibdelosporangium phytohabitans]